jgi:hypothetical protein
MRSVLVLLALLAVATAVPMELEGDDAGADGADRSQYEGLKRATDNMSTVRSALIAELTAADKAERADQTAAQRATEDAADTKNALRAEFNRAREAAAAAVSLLQVDMEALTDAELDRPLAKDERIAVASALKGTD